MGHELYRMIRDGAPPEWTPNMRLLAETIADDALDPSQHEPADGGWPRSAIRVRGGRSRSRDGEWYDGLTERTGMTERVISRTLTDLARADYDMREPLGTDRRGRPVFAYPGRTPRFRVPPLKPRGSPPSTATFEARRKRRPSEARRKRRPRKVAKSGDLGSTPDLATQVAADGELQTLLPNPSNPTSPHQQVSNSSLEGDRPAAATDDDDDDSRTQSADLDGGAEGAPAAVRDRPGPGYGLCPECRDWQIVQGYGGSLRRHNADIRGGRHWCPGSGREPVEPVPCVGCGRTDVALTGNAGLCYACRRTDDEAPW